jgi:tetratricopeptide (TPR) repeat protein
MPIAVRKAKTKKLEVPIQSGPSRLVWHRLNLALVILALVYAFLSGLHTVFDPDMGWHMATGRWVVQHHAIPSTDVLSYTSAGAEWLYPPFAGVLFYGIFSAWGYPGLTWFCTLVLIATVACLLRSPSREDSGFAAALAILAVPRLAVRANPRADLFTPLFFAVFLVLLWSFHQSDSDDQAVMRRERVRLWILPLSMLLWVNLHPGFVAGLGLIGAYLLIEGLDLFFPERRHGVQQRLRLAWPALAATVCATLINPYGPRVFKASLLLGGLEKANQRPGFFIGELKPVALSTFSLAQLVDWRRSPDNFWWLALAAVVVVALALWRSQLGAAFLLAAALYASMQHQRYNCLFAIVLVVVGATILAEVLQNRAQGGAKAAAMGSRLWSVLGAVAAGVLFLVTCVYIADLISSHRYFAEGVPMRFGVGESWWFPENAADFVAREQLPGNIFQVYNLGGFTAWRLGPAYGDFIDGRNLAPAVLVEEQEFLSSPPDSALWKAEADRRNINFLFFSLARLSPGGTPDLQSLCQSKEWRPVYLDDVSMVLLRNRSENRRWIDRYEVDCQTHTFTPPFGASHLELASFYANVGDILLRLGRLSEAREALRHAVALSPEDPSVHFALGKLFETQQQPQLAEQEYKATLSLGGESESIWRRLGELYYSDRRYAEARAAIATAARFAVIPASEYSMLGLIDLRLRQPEQALSDYAKAETVGERYWRGREDQQSELFGQIADGRAGAYAQLGDLQRAIKFEQLATQRAPENADRWKTLGDLYDKSGQAQLAAQARARAAALAK